MTTGARRLRDLPDGLVRIACTKCDRRGQYQRRTLFAEHHPDIALPDLLHRIAADCPRMTGRGNDRCGAYYADLTAPN